jgi:hypothetical protein
VRIEAPISVGELIDKITILEIKSKHLKGSSQAGNVENELGLLRQIMQRAGLDAAKLQPLTEELRAVNAALWTIEDEIRACDAAGDFGPRFTELARSVYRTNDRRSQIKRLINISCSSEIIEEKHYTDF